MCRRLMAFAVSILMAVLFFVPQQVLAAPDITVDAEAGIGNKVKSGEGMPVQITFSNAGSAFSGDVVLSYAESYRLGTGLAIPVELAAGESKTIQFASNGISDNYFPGGQSRQSIFLYEGGWENGTSIDFNGTKNFRPSFFAPDSVVIATLTANSDRLLQLEEMNVGNSGTTEIYHLNQQEEFPLPADPLAWEMIDYLVIDEYAYSDLPDALQQTILQWVQQGGKVMFGATGNVAAEAGNLNEFLPLSLGESVEADLPSLESTVPAYEAAAVGESNILLGQEEAILAASQPVGAGAVIQTSFSLGDEMVTAQQGYTETMESLFHTDAVVQNMYQDLSSKEMIADEMAAVNELFESFAVSQTLIIAIIFVYILLVVPVLYTVLKRKDKREYAWIAIPAIAVLTSIGLFVIGAKDRITNPQIQQTGFFEVTADQGLNGYYMNSLLSNRGGDYEFTAPSSTTMTHRFSTDFTEESPHQSAMLEKQATQTNLTIRDMKYWSVSSVLGESLIDQAGSFDIQLEVTDQTLTGTIQNNFPFAVEGMAVWTGTRQLALGSLNPGETIEVSEAIRSDVLAPPASVGQSFGFQPIADTEELEEARKQMVLSVSYEHLAANGASPYLIAYTRDAIVPVALEGQNASVSSLHLITQSFDPPLTGTGEVTLPVESFDMELTPENLASHYQNISQDPYYFYLDNGGYRLTYTLPQVLQEKTSNWEELTVALERSNASVSILNTETGEFEELSGTGALFEKQADQYVSSEGGIELSLQMNAGSGSPEIVLPKVELKGVISHD
ncbi:hypothetical protein [Planococcus salinus]|uniref:Uncharacterized protein n=1 Tax=Planococcus salinus TaxID=1848460 RepID=A0A3M8PBN4_9BACL|nr:hypothetical protein [Planococcus salinus]RNF40751.1 hypothetical protein EEX84_04820 [Planococcus salinus]